MSENVPVSFVTGASRGIGKGIALGMAKAGHDVIVNYLRNRTAAAEVHREIEKLGREALLLQGDIGSSEDRARMVDEAVAWKGRIDLLVNNAGIAPKVRLDLLETTEESFDFVLGANLKGPYFLTQAVAKAMIDQMASKIVETPRIVFVTSISAYAGSRMRTEYCVSKAGLSMTAQSFAMRLAHEGIPVFEIRPGLTMTDMVEPVKEKYEKFIGEGNVPQRRWGYPEDVAKAVRAVAEGDLDFSTGQVIEVAGGFLLREL